MKEDQPDSVIGKLGKVADTLENASTQLTHAVTQQQLDLVRERISKCESECIHLKSCVENITLNKSFSNEELATQMTEIQTNLEITERDYSGLRALSISSFVLSIVSLVCVILYMSKI